MYLWPEGRLILLAEILASINQAFAVLPALYSVLFDSPTSSDVRH